MGVGRWIGPGMTVGWHSFTPNEHPPLPVCVGDRDAKPDNVIVVRTPGRSRVVRRRP